jgi:hypothetical protein
MKPQLSLFAVGLCLAAVGCQDEEPWELAESTTSSPTWRNDAYPTLMRDCAFFACHGSTDRLFQIWGPKRHRLFDGELDDVGERERIGKEIQKTYDMAIGFVDINDPGNSLLLRKGLDAQAGGTGHLGLDKYGRNVYRSASSPGYVALSKWVFSLRPKPEGEL